jgi:ATP-binding cassette subfamily B protein
MKNIRRFFHYASGCRFLIAISLASALLSAGSRLYIPIVVAKAIDGMIGEGKVDFDIVVPCVLTIAILAAVSALSRYVYETTTAIFGQNIVKKMRDEIFFSFNSVPVSYLDGHDSGDLVSRLDNDVENVQVGLVGGLTAIYEGIVTIFFTAFFMASVNGVMALLVILLTPISLLATRFISHRNVSYFRLQAENTASFASKEA